VTLTFSGQAIFYVVRERRRIWSSRPSSVVILSSIADLAIIPTLAIRGILMTALAPSIVAAVFASAIVLAFALDVVKAFVFSRLRMV
jgi:H+-transporting ATPase